MVGYYCATLYVCVAQSNWKENVVEVCMIMIRWWYKISFASFIIFSFRLFLRPYLFIWRKNTLLNEWLSLAYIWRKHLLLDSLCNLIYRAGQAIVPGWRGYRRKGKKEWKKAKEGREEEKKRKLKEGNHRTCAKAGLEHIEYHSIHH